MEGNLLEAGREDVCAAELEAGERTKGPLGEPKNGPRTSDTELFTQLEFDFALFKL